MPNQAFSAALSQLVTLCGNVSGISFCSAVPYTSEQLSEGQFPALIIYEGPQRDDHSATSQSDTTVILAGQLMYKPGDTSENAARDMLDGIRDALNADPQLFSGGNPTCIHCMVQGGDPAVTWAESNGVSFRSVRFDLRYRRDN